MHITTKRLPSREREIRAGLGRLSARFIAQAFLHHIQSDFLPTSTLHGELRRPIAFNSSFRASKHLYNTIPSLNYTICAWSDVNQLVSANDFVALLWNQRTVNPSGGVPEKRVFSYISTGKRSKNALSISKEVRSQPVISPGASRQVGAPGSKCSIHQQQKQMLCATPWVIRIHHPTSNHSSDLSHLTSLSATLKPVSISDSSPPAVRFVLNSVEDA